MTDHFIDLTDGTRIEVKVNFGTMYYLQKTPGFYRLARKIDQKNRKGRKPSEEEGFQMAADLVYAILRSNGRKVTFDEALSLVPPDLETLTGILDDFQKEYEDYSKKKQGRSLTTMNR